MPNANIELFQPTKRVFAYLKGSPLSILVRLMPWLLAKTYLFQPTERIVEYPFIHENTPSSGKGNILDVGSGLSILPLELASKGYQVWSIDLKRGYHQHIRHSNWTFVQGDIRQIDFPDAFFDIVTAVSSIEHIGIEGGELNPNGDRDAVQEIKRILKPEGTLLISVPFGVKGIYSLAADSQLRVYDLLSLTELLGGFKTEKMEFALADGVNWRLARLEEVKDVDSVRQPIWHTARAVAMVVARKCSGYSKTNDAAN